MKILVTGAAGFIGFHVTKNLLDRGHTVVGLDNLNDYYDVALKHARLEELGISKKEAGTEHQLCQSALFKKTFQFVRMSIEAREPLALLFRDQKFDAVCHLAAQAGVRYSIENPHTYVESNVVGFLNILECCRHNSIKHLVYASSSSVYGSNKEIPFRVAHNVDQPISLYAATKKSNELMAHTYSHLYGFPTTGLRFFTVYGPWGRPDMAIYLFTDAIANDKPIKVFNYGEMERDFTYVDDIVEGVVRILEDPLTSRKQSDDLYRLYNIGNNQSVNLTVFISEIEKNLGKNAIKELLPMQAGDVEKTWANVDALMADYGYAPETNIQEGVKAFVNWYKKYNDL